MNKAGRLALVKSVLNAIPVHQLLIYELDKKVLKKIERIEHGFFWAGRAEANEGQYHVNWQRVCRPISLGGLGIGDLERAGLATRLRWQWFSRTDPNRVWQGLDLQFPAVERVFFFASTTMVIGDGRTARFWENRWIAGRSVGEFAPALAACIPRVFTKAAQLPMACKATAGLATSEA
jgi:hypothetical protein